MGATSKREEWGKGRLCPGPSSELHCLQSMSSASVAGSTEVSPVMAQTEKIRESLSMQHDSKAENLCSQPPAGRWVRYIIYISCSKTCWVWGGVTPGCFAPSCFVRDMLQLFPSFTPLVSLSLGVSQKENKIVWHTLSTHFLDNVISGGVRNAYHVIK